MSQDVPPYFTQKRAVRHIAGSIVKTRLRVHELENEMNCEGGFDDSNTEALYRRYVLIGQELEQLVCSISDEACRYLFEQLPESKFPSSSTISSYEYFRDRYWDQT